MQWSAFSFRWGCCQPDEPLTACAVALRMEGDSHSLEVAGDEYAFAVHTLPRSLIFGAFSSVWRAYTASDLLAYPRSLSMAIS